MSDREFCIVLAHALWCGACRARLIQDPASVTTGRSLSGDEKGRLAILTEEHFSSPNTLAKTVNLTTDQLASFADHPVVRLRHL